MGRVTPIISLTPSRPNIKSDNNHGLPSQAQNTIPIPDNKATVAIELLLFNPVVVHYIRKRPPP